MFEVVILLFIQYILEMPRLALVFNFGCSFYEQLTLQPVFM